jgi:endonuclease YncB( thermonuclease family)
MAFTRLRLALAGCTAALLPLTFLAASPAQAGPWDGVQAWETAIVQRIVDGDTLIVNDQVTGAESRIRLLGINSPEKDAKAKGGQCGGWQAMDALSALLPLGSTVRLLSSDPNSRGKDARPQRVVLAQNPITGEYDFDVAWAMAERGWGLWFTVAKEASMSSLYREVIAGAQARKEGMWNPNLCGELEQPDASVDLRITRGANNSSPTDEWVTVRNTGAADVDLSGWTLRDSGNTGWFTFPGGSIINPGDYRVVHTGTRPSTANDPRSLYANARVRLYPDPGTGRPNTLLGDGAYLLDRYGNYRFWREYPCTIECAADPLNGSIIIEDISLGKKRGKARAATQWMRLLNRSDITQCLDGYRIETGNTRYRFPSGTCIAPGGTWSLRVGKGRPLSTTAYLGKTVPVLWNSGSITIYSDKDQVIALRSW